MIIRLTPYSRQAMTLVEGIPIFIKVRYLKLCVWFGDIDGLAVSAILGTSLIDRFIQAKSKEERKILHRSSREIEILETSTYNSTLSLILDEKSAFTVKEEAESSKEIPSEIIDCIQIFVARQRMIPPISEARYYSE